MNSLKKNLLNITSNALFGGNFGLYNGLILGIVADTISQILLKTSSFFLCAATRKAANAAFITTRFGLKTAYILAHFATRKTIFPLVISSSRYLSNLKQGIKVKDDLRSFSPEKLRILRSFYLQNRFIDIKAKRFISYRTDLSPRQVSDWFKRQRLKDRSKALKVDYVKLSRENRELLKNYFRSVNKYPTKSEIESLSKKISLSEKWIRRYFTNQRSQLRKKKPQ
jgi:hypothetical protein